MAIPSLLAPLAVMAAAIPVITGQTGTQQSSDIDIVGLDKDAEGRMTVPVRVHERGPFNFLVDTGAQNTVVSSDLAARLAMPSRGRATLVGVAGKQQVDAVAIEQLDIGRRSYFGLYAPLLEQRNIGADGILGVDSLQNQRVVIDFRKKLMAIGDARDLGGNRGYDIVVTARRRSGQLIVTNARINGIATNVVIDTGAFDTIGNRALQNAIAKRSKNGVKAYIRSVTGQEIEADIGVGRTLALGGISINNMRIAYADVPAFDVLKLSDKPAILLGMRELGVFQRIAVDFSTRKVMFDLPDELLDPLSGYGGHLGMRSTADRD